MAKKIFIAAPLFNEMEKNRNLEIATFIEKLGFDVFLPQREVGVCFDVIDSQNKEQIRQKIFDADMEGIKKCDVILILLDGRTPDEGACLELGVAWATNKTCIGYKTDNRAMDQNGDDNLMIDCCLKIKVSTLDELKIALTSIENE